MVAGNPRSTVSNDKSEWQTPPWLFKRLNDEFQFNLDAAATFENRLVNAFFDKNSDALTKDWGGKGSTVFLNPPFGRGAVDAFAKKAFWESRDGAIVVCLFPFSGAKWFRTYCLLADEIRIIGRVKFIGKNLDGTLCTDRPSMQDICVVVFRPGVHVARLTTFD